MRAKGDADFAKFVLGVGDLERAGDGDRDLSRLVSVLAFVGAFHGGIGMSIPLRGGCDGSAIGGCTSGRVAG